MSYQSKLDMAIERRAAANEKLNDAFDVLHMAYNALRSYQYGNSSPELAEACAGRVKEFLEAHKYQWGKSRSVNEILADLKHQHEAA